MTFFEGLGMFIVAAVLFLAFSFLISLILAYNHTDWICLVGWLAGSVIYGLTVVGLIYISRNGGRL